MNIKHVKATSIVYLLIALVIVTIIAIIYYMMLAQDRIRGHRHEAQNELIKLKNSIELHAVNGTFKKVDGTIVSVNSVMEVAKILEDTTAKSPFSTPNNYYNIIVSITAQPLGYVLTATPQPTSSQIKDSEICQKILLTVPMNSMYEKSPAECWKY